MNPNTLKLWAARESCRVNINFSLGNSFDGSLLESKKNTDHIKPHNSKLPSKISSG